MHISLPHPLLRSRERRATSQVIGFASCAVYLLAGSTYVAFMKLLSEGLSPLSILFLSESLVVTFTILSFGFIPLLRAIMRVKKKEAVPLIFIGVCNSVIPPLLAFTGIRMTEATNIALFSSTDILFLFLFSVILLEERVERRQIVSGAIMVLGIVTLETRGFTEAASPHWGDILILASAALYSLGSITFKKYIVHTPPEAVMFARGCISILAFLIISLFVPHGIVEEVQSPTPVLLLVLFAYGFITRFVGLFTFYESIERIPVHIVSLLLPLSTVGSIAFAAYILTEPILWFHIIGGMCIVLGSVVVQFHSNQRTSEGELERHLQHQRP